jgi:hypothetical protein
VSTVGADLEYQIAGLQEALSACVRVIVRAYVADGLAVPAALRAFQEAEAGERDFTVRPASLRRRGHLSLVASR